MNPRVLGLLPFLGLCALSGWGGPDFRSMSIDEVEVWWVKSRIRARRKLEEDAMRAIAGLAKATGPYRHQFGYCRHEATRPKPQSDSLKRMLGGKKRGQYKKPAFA